MKPNAVLVALLVTGCVPRASHELTQVQLEATRLALQSRTADCQRESFDLQERIHFLQGEIDSRERRIGDLQAELADLEEEVARHHLKEAIDIKDEAELEESVEDIRDALVLLERERTTAQRWIERWGDVAAAFKPLLDDDRVSLHVIHGQIVVRIPSDPMFNLETAALSPYGTDAVQRIASVLSKFSGQRFQVEGHTDNVPRHSADFPSNWELGFARAVAVVRGLQEAGLRAELGAVSYADTIPLASGDNEDTRRMNRRLEIVFLAEEELGGASGQ